MKILKTDITVIPTIAQLELDNYSTPYTHDSLLNELLHDDSLFFYSQNSKDKITGYIIARLILGECEIHRITVDHNFRRQGIAQNLLDHICKICIDRTAHAVFLEVSEKNHPAIGFYQKNNFIKIARRKNYYGDSDALILQKRITYVNDPIERLC